MDEDIKIRAYKFAFEVHKGQKRKDGIDYINHPVEVATILAKNGASDTLIAAGLLHDTIEDANVTKEKLYSLFPKEVVDIVLLDSEDKSKSWEERKQTTFNNLSTCDNTNFLMLVCADKVSNLRSIKKQIEHGEDVFSKFKRGKDSQKWLYENLLKSLKTLAGLDMYKEFESLVKQVFE